MYLFINLFSHILQLSLGIDPHADITRELTLKQMLLPPTGKGYDDLVLSGYNEIISWDGKFKKKVGVRFTNYSGLLGLWPLKFIEIFVNIIEDFIIYINNMIRTYVQSFMRKYLPVDFKESSLRNLSVAICFPFIIVGILSIFPYPSVSSQTPWILLSVAVLSVSMLEMSFSCLPRL